MVNCAPSPLSLLRFVVYCGAADGSEQVVDVTNMKDREILDALNKKATGATQ